MNHGKLISPIEKPLDTPKHCKLQIAWVFEWYGLLTNPYSPICYIDKKWFYWVSRRRKIKVLPNSDMETQDTEVGRKTKMLSHRFPIKTMFMGVVARPIPHRQFNGKIILERVPKKDTYRCPPLTVIFLTTLLLMKK